MSDILIGKGERPVHLLAKYGNRHGLVAGATGTGKTISRLRGLGASARVTEVEQARSAVSSP